MSDSYYKPCRELEICNELIEKYFNTQQYEKCFQGHLALARQGYPLAECQIGYFYYEGLGVKKDPEKAAWWTRRAADHGDQDGQYNLAWFHEKAIGVERDPEQAEFWYRKAASQGHALAIRKCTELGISPDAPLPDPETARSELKCRVYPLNFLAHYKYVVICTSWQGKWVLSKHKKRDTWETQGGQDTSRRARHRWNAPAGSFTRKAASGMRTFIRSAIIGASAPKALPTAWFFWRLSIHWAPFPRAKCRK